jgi:LmbE family N-acetylglucosaminyl deacetylase
LRVIQADFIGARTGCAVLTRRDKNIVAGLTIEPAFTAPFKVLIIVAHPDDIEFGTGGSVAVWTSAGAEVVYCIVTDGSAGSNAVDADLVALIGQRREEQTAAAAAVGVHEVIFLGYKDGTLQPTIELRKALTRVIRQTKPNRVVIMDPTSVLLSGEDFDYINHPDHRATGEASLYAIFPSSETRPIFPELLAEGYDPHHVNEVYVAMSTQPNIIVDITAQWERKIEALLCHKSQLDDSVVEMIRGWDSRVGQEMGIPFAETFRKMAFYERNPAIPPASEDGDGSV